MSGTDIVEDWTVLAHLLRPQGRKGEVLAELLTDFPERFTQFPQVHLGRPTQDNRHRVLQPATVEHHWLPVGRNHGRIVLTLAGINTIEAAESLAGLDVIIAPESRVPLEENAEYISDLVDCEVFDRGTLIGRVIGVEFATSPDGARRLADAAPLLTVVNNHGEEILIPYVQQFLVSLAVDQKRIEMDLPEGLIDLNRRPAEAATELFSTDADAHED